MPIIKAQKVPKRTEPIEDILAQFCYHFPQYTFSTARKMPYKRIIQMLKVAQKEQAKYLYQVTQVVAAPHTKKGAGVKTVLKYFQDIIEKE